MFARHTANLYNGLSLSGTKLCILWVLVLPLRFGLRMRTPHQASSQTVDERKMMIKPGMKNAATWDRSGTATGVAYWLLGFVGATRRLQLYAWFPLIHP